MSLDWKIEERPSVERDLDQIFDHAVAAALGHGYGPDEAVAMAAARLTRIARARDRLARTPYIGTRRIIDGFEYRNVTLERCVLWFTLDEDRQVITLEGIFHGGQDHAATMFSRLGAEGD